MTGEEPNYEALQQLLDLSRHPRSDEPFRVIASVLGEPLRIHWVQSERGWRAVLCEGLSCTPCWNKERFYVCGLYAAIYRKEPTKLVTIRAPKRLMGLMQRHPVNRCFQRVGEGLLTDYVLGPEFLIERTAEELL